MKNSNISFLLSFFLLLALSCGKTDDPLPLKSKEKQITSFKVTINEQEIISTITEADKKISLAVPYKSDVKALAPVIAISDKATISPASGVAQDFTNPVKYMVTAQDGNTSEYTATVTVMPPSKCLPTKAILSGVGFTSELAYEYNSNDQIVKSTFVTSSGATGSVTITYNSQGNIVKQEGSTDTYYRSYIYNVKNLLIRTEHLKKTDNSLESKTEFEYNLTDQLTKKDEFYTSSGTLSYSTTYEYSNTTSKNWIQSKEFDGTRTLQSTTEYEYDTNKTIGADVYKFTTENSNNVTKTTRKDTSGNLVQSIQITYEYNERGQPTKIVETRNSGIGSTPTVSTSAYTYNCK